MSGCPPSSTLVPSWAHRKPHLGRLRRERLAADWRPVGCDVHFALVQDGMEWPAGHRLELVGRLGKAESLVFLGRDADQIKSLGDLRGKRIGLGPVGSGTERVARQVLAPLGELGMNLSTHALDEQLARLATGELDLGAMVIDEDARLLREAVRDGKLQILDLPAAEVLARLWRIDANRVRAEASILPLFGPGVTVGEIAEMAPSTAHETPAGRAEIDGAVERLAWLSERCRRQSMSMLVPMGQEMAYRYQEALIADLLYALRAYRSRFARAGGTPAPD